jgi:hypothetical protein
MTLLLAAPALAQDKVELKVVKYDDLTKLVKDARGKVVIVELWQDG